MRSKLPDSALTADQLKQRKTNTYNNAPAAPGSGYTNKQIKAVVDAMAKAQFGSQQAALAQRGQSLPGWFQAYRDQINAARAAEQTASGQQVTSLQGMATAAQGDTGQLAGAPMDAEGAARAQAAAAVRSAGIQNQAALAQTLGANQNDYLTNMGLNSFGLQRGEQDKQDAAVKQLASDLGTFRTTTHDKVLSDEADNALKAALTGSQITNNVATAAGTAAKTAKTKTDTARSAADQAYFQAHGYYPSTGKPKAADTSATASVAAKHGYSLAEWQKMTPDARRTIIAHDNKTSTSPANTKDEFGNTRRQRQAANDAFDKALRLAHRSLSSDTSGKFTKDPGLLVDFLISENVNSALARAAVQAATHDGRLGPKTTQRLKQRGVSKFPQAKPAPPKPSSWVQKIGELANPAGS
ncbi:hypothetical protein FSW04_17660 [Baekduia soli]|uniref:Uncharacterized protein n=1 Tax=Baekduia soli TaxID=496014 RepID=A0A5B8U8E7_9ACTN|nr:hypothetical protein [Baekduia soli]QEC49225.1 hypothetical protein FSW04_17660 [Baekduia soli]